MFIIRILFCYSLELEVHLFVPPIVQSVSKHLELEDFYVDVQSVGAFQWHWSLYFYQFFIMLSGLYSSSRTAFSFCYKIYNAMVVGRAWRRRAEVVALRRRAAAAVSIHRSLLIPYLTATFQFIAFSSSSSSSLTIIIKYNSQI